MKKSIKLTLSIIAGVLALILLAAVGYIIYVFADYHRIEDNFDCNVIYSESRLPDDILLVAETGKEYKIITYNIGFCAYTPDFSFFMDGGDESRAESAESVNEVLGGISDYLNEQYPDFLMLQEVDVNATRSHHINQAEALRTAISGRYFSSFICNYDSPYLFYPFLEPHGKSYAGMMIFSRIGISSTTRRSLPVEDGFMKLLDLDRCYSVSRVPVENGKELVLYTVHLSAYTSDGKVTTEQTKMLIADMKAEYEKGNYVVCGGDFNKDLLGNSSEIFGVDGSEQTWAQPFPEDMLEGTGLSLVSSLDESNPVPSCRNADAPYSDTQFVLTVDGFIVSDNVKVASAYIDDLGFEYSDHNPAVMTFVLE